MLVQDSLLTSMHFEHIQGGAGCGTDMQRRTKFRFAAPSASRPHSFPRDHALMRSPPPWLMLRPNAVPLLAAVYYCSWGRRAALPPPPARFATRSLLHANGVTHDARSARHSQRKGAACGQRHGTAARGNSHALPKIPQALQRAESSKSRSQGTMSVVYPLSSLH